MAASARPAAVDAAAGDGSPAAVRVGDGPGGEPSTADLVRGLAEDASKLVRQEVELAKQELTEGLTEVGKGAGLLAGAGVLGLFALGFLLTTLAWALEAIGLPKWASFGIVTLLLLIVVAVLGLLGQRQLKKAKVKPEKAQAEFQQAKQELTSEARTGVDLVKTDVQAQAKVAQDEARKFPDRAKAEAGQAATDARERINRVVDQARREAQRIARQARARTSGDDDPQVPPG